MADKGKSEAEVKAGEVKDIPLALMGGRVLDPGRGLDGECNIFISKGKIQEVGINPPPEGYKKINAKGLVVTPGFIDLHTHLREPGHEYKEDIRSGSKAALAGGFTAVLCMPNTNPACDGKDIVERIRNRAKEIGLIDIYPVAAITKGLKGEELSPIAAMAKAGIVAISDDGACVQNDALMREAMEIAKKKKLLVIDHPEDTSLSAEGVMNEGDLSRKYKFTGVPREAENFAINRDIKLARESGCRLHVAHISTLDGIEMIRQAKEEGLPVTCEVTPHHLLLTEVAISQIGPNAKMNPPLRLEVDRDALIQGLVDGTVDAIATDHAPHASDEKIDVKTAAFGVIGMETAFPACMKLVEEGHLALERLVELLTSGPAMVAGLKCGIVVGNPADITIFDTEKEFKIASREFRSKSRNTPFEGWVVKGRIRYTISKGKISYKSNA